MVASFEEHNPERTAITKGCITVKKNLKRRRAKERRREFNEGIDFVPVPIEILRAALHGKKWNAFNSRSVLKVGQVYFRGRIGYVMGRLARAIIARQQFVVVDYIPLFQAKKMERWAQTRGTSTQNFDALDPHLVKNGHPLRWWQDYFELDQLIFKEKWDEV